MHTDSRRYNDRYEIEREILDIFTFYRVADRMREFVDKVKISCKFNSNDSGKIFDNIFMILNSCTISDDIDLDDIPNIFRRVFDTKQYQDAINIQDQAIVKTFG
jgi:hypothetical protein